MSPSPPDVEFVVAVVTSLSTSTAWAILTSAARRIIRRASPRDRDAILAIGQKSINDCWPGSIRACDDPVSEAFGNSWEIVYEKEGYRYTAGRSLDKRGDVQVERSKL
jgi:hypothetical protein